MHFLAPATCRRALTSHCPERNGFFHVPVPSWVVCGEKNRKSCLTKRCCLKSRRLWENRASRNPFVKAIQTKSSLLVEVFPRPSRQSKPQSKVVKRRSTTSPNWRLPIVDESFFGDLRASLWKTGDDGQSGFPNDRWHPARTEVLGCCRERAQYLNLRLHSRD